MVKNLSYKQYLAAPLLNGAVFVIVAALMLAAGDVPQAAVFTVFALITSGAMIVFALLPAKNKKTARRVSVVLIGLALLATGVFSRMNFQIEGFFFVLLTGFASGALLHYLIAKILGPLLFNRNWCGWGCWTLILLEALPYQRSPGRLRGGWERLRPLHLALSLGLAAALVFGFGYQIFFGFGTPEQWDKNFAGAVWFIGGNIFYYAAGTVMAVVLKDNRAFCKYLCPVAQVLKIGASVSVLRIKGDQKLCTDCGACAKVCPADLDVPKYHNSGRRVVSTECVMCLSCVAACPTGALSASAGFDLPGPNHFCYRETAKVPKES